MRLSADCAVADFLMNVLLFGRASTSSTDPIEAVSKLDAFNSNMTLFCLPLPLPVEVIFGELVLIIYGENKSATVYRRYRRPPRYLQSARRPAAQLIWLIPRSTFFNSSHLLRIPIFMIVINHVMDTINTFPTQAPRVFGSFCDATLVLEKLGSPPVVIPEMNEP